MSQFNELFSIPTATMHQKPGERRQFGGRRAL